MKIRLSSSHEVGRLGLIVLVCLVLMVSNVAAREPAPPAASIETSPSVSLPASLPPPKPFNPYGMVQVNGVNVEPGILVGGWCGGALWDTYPAEFDEGTGRTWYSLEIPGDEPATPDEVEGCNEGDKVTFTIGGLPTSAFTTWSEGASDENHLDISFGVDVSKQISADSITWHDADTEESALNLDAGTPITWRIGITNTSMVTVALALTDTLDEGVVLLPTVCEAPPPSMLAPAGEAGANYTCMIDDITQPDVHRNLISATIAAGEWSVDAADVAHLFGVERKVYLPLVLR